MLCPLSVVSCPHPQLRRTPCCISFAKIPCAVIASYLNFCVPCLHGSFSSVAVVRLSTSEAVSRHNCLSFCTGVRFLVWHVSLASVLVRHDFFANGQKVGCGYNLVGCRLAKLCRDTRWVGCSVSIKKVGIPKCAPNTACSRLGVRAALFGLFSRL